MVYEVRAAQGHDLILRTEDYIKAKTVADQHKTTTGGRNAHVYSVQQVYTTTTLDEALAESKAEREPIPHIHV